MKAILLINKNARQMRKHRTEFVGSIVHKYPELEIKIISPRKIRRAVSTAALDGYQRIIVCGGDGTVATAAHVLAKTDTELGIVPGGTTNSFARSLNLPLDISDAFHHALTADASPTNLGSVNGNYFISVSALGLSEQVASTIPDSLKKTLGRTSYIIWGIVQFFINEPLTVSIEADGEKHEYITHQLVVANARLHGSLPVAKGASAYKDELVLLSFGKDGSKLRHLKNLILYSRSKHDDSPGVVLLRGTEFVLSTGSRRKVEVDGEVVTQTPATFSLEKDALNIVAGSKQATKR